MNARDNAPGRGAAHRALWLNQPGTLELPSGRPVTVLTRDQHEVTVELGRDMQVRVNDEHIDTDGYLLGLEWVLNLNAPPRPTSHVFAAVVRYDEHRGTLAAGRPPITPHSKECECDSNERASFAAWLPEHRMLGVLEILARLPMNTEYWEMPTSGSLLWRGRLDAQGRALIEHLLPDEMNWEELEGPPVVAAVNIGF